MNIHALLNTLTKQEKEELKDLLIAHSHSNLQHALEENSPNKQNCPHCQHSKFIRVGKTRNVQRYKCKGCGKTFGLNTNTFVHKTHKPLATWDRYIQLMIDGYSIRRIARKLKITTTTALYWRHKILAALKSIPNTKLNGIVEADETFFRLSYKGQKKDLTRKARKRGGEARKRGTSKEQVCVLTAIDRNKGNWMKPVCLGRLSTEHLYGDFADQISSESVLVTDKHRAYIRFCEDKELSHKTMYSMLRRDGAYHLQNVNGLHSQLKRFMRPFNGVATKYLDNYLAYWQWMRKDVVSVLGCHRSNVSYKALSSARMALV